MSNTPNYDRLMDVIALVETAAIYIQPNHENIRIQETVTAETISSQVKAKRPVIFTTFNTLMLILKMMCS
mgnify:CR=1 FL=1